MAMNDLLAYPKSATLSHFLGWSVDEKQFNTYFVMQELLTGRIRRV